MPTSNPDWSILASENERLMDSRASQVTPRPAPSTAILAPAPAPRLRWRRRAGGEHDRRRGGLAERW